MNDMELEDLEYRLENLRSGANVQNVPVQSNVEDLVERFNQLDGVREAGLELPQREFDMEPYIIRGMSQRDIAETDRRRRTDGLRRRRAAQTLQRSLEIDAVEEVEKELNRDRVKIPEPCVYMKDYKILFAMEIQIQYY